MFRPPCSPDEREKVLESFGRLGKYTAVAAETGVHRTTVRRIVEGEGPTIDVKEAIREAVATALAEFHAKGEAGKPEVVVEAETPQPKPGLLVHAPKPYRRVAFMSDFHFPYHSQAAIDAALAFLGDWSPDLIILGGDQVDCYRISDYESDAGRASTLQEELDSIHPFWRAIDAFSSADVVVFEGNHEHRLTRLVNKNPGLYNLRSLHFPVAAELPKRFQWYRSQTHYKVGSLVFLHGDLRGRGNSVKHAAAGMLDKLRTSCVFGHFHRTGEHYETGYDGTVRAGFAVGHMSDQEKAAEYIRSPSWQQSFATVEFDHDEGIFHFSKHLIVNGRFVFNGKTYRG
jgi:predicted phosphodiesterase